MAHELPEEIQSRLEQIAKDKQRIAEIGQRLGSIIQTTEQQLRDYRAYVEAEVTDEEDSGRLSWTKWDDKSWSLVWQAGGFLLDDNRTTLGPPELAVDSDLFDKAMIVEFLPALLDTIAGKVNAQRALIEYHTRQANSMEGA